MNPLLVKAVHDLTPGRALDLACGAGGNAVWLAERGWEVVAIDREPRLHDPRIDTRTMDLETGAPLPFDDESFDLVAILYYMHRPLYAEAKRVVRRGGVIVAAPLMRGRFRVEPGELPATFADFEIVHYREGDTAELIAIRCE